jgi:hypothetical protein
MSCGELGPIEGGLIKNSTIQDSQLVNCDLTGGKITGAELDSCELENLASCDSESARTIAGAIADDASAIRDIADGIADDATAAGAIAEAISNSNPAAYGNPAAAVAAPELPTYMYGSRDAVLGKPAAWMKVGDYVIPVYAKAGS